LTNPLRQSPTSVFGLPGPGLCSSSFRIFTIPPHSGEALAKLRQSGTTPIIAHPERYTNIDDDLEILGEWKRIGAFLQLNAGSLVGAYGSAIEERGWQVVERGLADYVSSDYHARGKLLSALATERMRARKGDVQSRSVSVTNPARSAARREPVAIDPLPKAGRFRALRAALRRAKPSH
jgi:protein-tyrosine phosphatase